MRRRTASPLNAARSRYSSAVSPKRFDLATTTSARRFAKLDPQLLPDVVERRRRLRAPCLDVGLAIELGELHEGQPGCGGGADGKIGRASCRERGGVE